MEKKLDKICKLKDADINERYCFNNTPDEITTFIVKTKTNDYISAEFHNGIRINFYRNEKSFIIDFNTDVYEYKLSSLEKELM